MAKSKKSLAETHPELAKEWHPTKNESLTPNDMTPGSGKKVWWKCDKGSDHIWIASCDKRTTGRGCPVCSGKKVVLSNCFASLYPELCKQWHPTKNAGKTPYDFTSKSNKKIWWKCDVQNDHEWDATISDRVRGRGCPVCAGRKVVNSNRLSKTHPNIARQFHPEKNGKLTPDMFMIGSHKKIWWQCETNHEHIWRTRIIDRLKHNCPFCSGQKLHESNSLATTHKNIASEWHPTKNGILTPSDVVSGGRTKYWWQCDVSTDHEWQATISSRKRGRGCPICVGKLVVESNSLTTTHPHLIKEWYFEKNTGTSPGQVSQGSDLKVWWKCNIADDHIWLDSISHRTISKRGCAVCAGRKVVLSNCLATTFPESVNLWHPSKNGKITPYSITQHSHKKVWWRCSKNNSHEWKSAVYSIANHGCPYCTLTPQSKQELTITFELRTLFKRINPKGFKTRLNGRLRAIDIFIPKLNLCIEFDGSYWHKGKREIDKIKSNLLLKEGYSVIRVREEPLKKIHDTDVISKQPYDGKQVTNDILSMILSMYDLDSELVQRIKGYQSKGELQNESGLNRYIDKILKEKAEKK